jgi:hypothetical protein
MSNQFRLKLAGSSKIHVMQTHKLSEPPVKHKNLHRDNWREKEMLRLLSTGRSTTATSSAYCICTYPKKPQPGRRGHSPDQAQRVEGSTRARRRDCDCEEERARLGVGGEACGGVPVCGRGCGG